MSQPNYQKLEKIRVAEIFIPGRTDRNVLLGIFITKVFDCTLQLERLKSLSNFNVPSVTRQAQESKIIDSQINSFRYSCSRVFEQKAYSASSTRRINSTGDFYKRSRTFVPVTGNTSFLAFYSRLSVSATSITISRAGCDRCPPSACSANFISMGFTT